MFRAILILAAVLAATVCSAADQLTIYKIDSPGYYAIQDGRLIPVHIVTPGTPTPTPDPTPQPDVLSPDAKAVKAAAEKATSDPNQANTAKGLATAAGLIRKSIDDGTLTTYETISKGLVWMWDATAKHAAWAPVRKLVTDKLDALAQEGANPAAYSVYLGDVERGLTAVIPANLLMDDATNTGNVTVTVGGQEAKLQGNWSEILKVLLELFIKFILPLIIS